MDNVINYLNEAEEYLKKSKKELFKAQNSQDGSDMLEKRIASLVSAQQDLEKIIEDDRIRISKKILKICVLLGKDEHENEIIFNFNYHESENSNISYRIRLNKDLSLNETYGRNLGTSFEGLNKKVGNLLIGLIQSRIVSMLKAYPGKMQELKNTQLAFQESFEKISSLLKYLEK